MDEFLHFCIVAILVSLLLFRFIVIEENRLLYLQLNNSFTEISKLREELQDKNMQMIYHTEELRYYISDIYNQLNNTV